jgi:hypothetical protein
VSESRDIPATQRFAWLLGLAGLLPFFSHALFAWLTSPYEVAGVLRSQAHYAAVILTFVGALHWGVTIASPSIVGTPAGSRMVWSVLPATYAWIVSLFPVELSIPLLTGGLLVALAVDWRLYRHAPVPDWFFTLRLVLSIGALASLGASWWAMAARMVR